MAMMNKAQFERMLELAKAKAAARKEPTAQIDQLQAVMLQKGVQQVDLSNIVGPKATEEEVHEVVEDIVTETALPIITTNHGNMQVDPTHSRVSAVLGVARDDIILNSKQQEFHDRVQDQEDVVLIGAAGTGKTTSVRKTSRTLVDTPDRLPKLLTGTKVLIAGHPGAAIVSYTRKAVNNIRHAVVDELKAHTLTIHKLLEFEPIFYEIEDPANPGELKMTMKFEPARNRLNPLPAELIFLGFEETSMISVELYQQLEAAMPHPHQEVFLGDIQQLPPIFGLAVLGFKMLELPVIELTDVYRQALESPIIALAWKILEGDTKAFIPNLVKEPRPGGKGFRTSCPAYDALSIRNETGFVKLQHWQKSLAPDAALLVTSQQFHAWIEEGYYNPEQDVILCPFNKSFGCVELNKSIADYLVRKRKGTVYEVIAGFNKHYLAVGDRVLYDKEDAFITQIIRNGRYLGIMPQSGGVDLNRWGGRNRDDKSLQQSAKDSEQGNRTSSDEEDFDLSAIDDYMNAVAGGGEDEDRVNEASHIIHIRYAWQDDDDTNEVVLSSAGEINSLLGGYALTVHKFQGSEADTVFIVMHASHEVMNKRELLYTAVTRAKKRLHIICENNTFFKGIQRQAIKGNTLAAKARFFMGKLDANQETLRLEHNSLGKKPAAVVEPNHDPIAAGLARLRDSVAKVV